MRRRPGANAYIHGSLDARPTMAPVPNDDDVVTVVLELPWRHVVALAQGHGVAGLLPSIYGAAADVVRSTPGAVPETVPDGQLWGG